jgi:hypothetical protein
MLDITNIEVSAILQNYPEILKALNEIQANNLLNEKLNNIIENQDTPGVHAFLTFILTILIVLFVITALCFTDLSNENERTKSANSIRLKEYKENNLRIIEINEKIEKMQSDMNSKLGQMKIILEKQNHNTTFGKKINTKVYNDSTANSDSENSSSDEESIGTALSFVDVKDPEYQKEETEEEFKKKFYKHLDDAIAKNKNDVQSFRYTYDIEHDVIITANSCEELWKKIDIRNQLFNYEIFYKNKRTGAYLSTKDMFEKIMDEFKDEEGYCRKESLAKKYPNDYK